MNPPIHPLDTAWRDLERRFDAACTQSRAQTVNEINQLLRRFRQYHGEMDWVRLVLEGAGAFARQVALFSLDAGNLRLRGEANLDLPKSLSFACAQAAAFEAVRTSSDAVVALRTDAEVTEMLSSSDPEQRVHLFPISNASRVSAILFTVMDASADAQALELVAGLASCALERQANVVQHAQIGSATPAPSPRAARLPAWADLDESQRQLHVRARRFARVTVAGMQLSKPEACRAGREQGDLYLFLKNEIDKAREIYSKQFRTISSMSDYLHLELVRIAAEGDELKLGADYPGQLA
jgi:hypothetical protein